MSISLNELSDSALDQLEKDIKSERAKRANAEYEAFQQQVAALAREKGFPIPAFKNGKGNTKAKQGTVAKAPSVPPTGVPVIENPANPSQRWWVGKRGAKPGWAK